LASDEKMGWGGGWWGGWMKRVTVMNDRQRQRLKPKNENKGVKKK
jgi:hypothetical protein